MACDQWEQQWPDEQDITCHKVTHERADYDTDDALMFTHTGAFPKNPDKKRGG
ncbi:hypothetical protein LVY75_21795 [Sinorhizobium sp. B11]